MKDSNEAVMLAAEKADYLAVKLVSMKVVL